MALVERLMHVDADPTRNMAVHEFFAAVTELISGNLTAAQIQNHYGMTAADLVDWNAIAALVPAANQAAARALFCGHLHAVFILAEARAPTFSTPAEVRARLGI
jgi:hypothetical protein